MVLPWCSVFHHCTREHDDRQVDGADQRQDGGGAVAVLRIIEGADQRDMAEIQEEQHQHRGKAGIPDPIGAPHRLAPERSGDQADEGEAGADRADFLGRQIGQRVAPDDREERAEASAAYPAIATQAAGTCTYMMRAASPCSQSAGAKA